MTNKKTLPDTQKAQPKEKARLHPRNKHRERYDFKALIGSCPELAAFVQLNIHNDESINFSDPKAVKMLNKALLKHHYDIDNWDIPEGYLCPPIPGRADYIHHIAEVLSRYNFGKIPTGEQIKCLDIGVGANCVYPIIGHKEYGWSFIGVDIDAAAIESAKNILVSNPTLESHVELRLQDKPKDIFYGILDREERIDVMICNPPFHSSLEDAQSGTLRKLNNLNPKKEKITEPVLNFGGQNNELWCEGGEVAFVEQIIRQSQRFSQTCFCFSTLISKQSHLKSVYAALKKAVALNVKTIEMGQGNKTSRIVTWTFLNREQQQAWREMRWKGNDELLSEK